ncbi:hypothetical protein [Streptomyces sp. URMC 123]|uniref:hypothetical protein n=1 Tax=Streptomyces sp. URMC 123 TaxID=3423403 RepID=UPI003F1E3E7B
MTVILDVKFNDFARDCAKRQLEYGYSLDEMAEDARGMCWAGFGIVDDGTGEPLEDYRPFGYYNCDCQENPVRVNAEATRAAFKAAGVETHEVNGWIVWDASNPAGHSVADSIACHLADYAVLDDERLSDLQWDNACAMIDSLYDLPEGVEADDLIRVMPEVPHCRNCSSWDAEGAMASLGYSQCMDCSAWLKMDGYPPSDRVCYDCAEHEQEGDCECIPEYVNSLRHMSLYPTASDLREIQRGCLTCYPIRWPHGTKMGA